MEWQVTDLLNVEGAVELQPRALLPRFADLSCLDAERHRQLRQHRRCSGLLDVGLPGANGLMIRPTTAGTGAALRLQQERRYAVHQGRPYQRVKYGGDEFNVQGRRGLGRAISSDPRLRQRPVSTAKPGAASTPTTFLPSPNTVSGCSATPPATIAGGLDGQLGHRLFGRSRPRPDRAGPAAAESAIAPVSAPGPNGFAKVDYAGIKAVTNYDYFATNAPRALRRICRIRAVPSFSIGTNTNISSGIIDEKTIGFYGEINGTLHCCDQKLRYNIGARWIRTLQSLTGYTSVVDRERGDLRRSTPDGPDGAQVSEQHLPATLKGSYSAFLPSANVVWEVTGRLPGQSRRCRAP